ncbi:MAG TPA: cytochrome c [Rhodocyclaceae bacterium]
MTGVNDRAQREDESGAMRKVMVIVIALASLEAAAAGELPDAARQAELTRLVREDCGSCHGMRLTGGLGTPLTAEALRGKPAEALVATVTYGHPGTAMPPWRTMLSEADIRWIVTQLTAGFPEMKR